MTIQATEACMEITALFLEGNHPLLKEVRGRSYMSWRAVHIPSVPYSSMASRTNEAKQWQVKKQHTGSKTCHCHPSIPSCNKGKRAGRRKNVIQKGITPTYSPDHQFLFEITCLKSRDLPWSKHILLHRPGQNFPEGSLGGMLCTCTSLLILHFCDLLHPQPQKTL